MTSQNILVTTLGSWSIIPELLGFTNPKQLDLYTYHPEKQIIEQTRSQYHIKPVHQIWLISTDSDIIREKSIKPLSEWNRKLPEPFVIRNFLLKGVNDLISQNSVREMADLIYRVVLLASEQKGNGQLLLSLAGGRKTMSADMQQAGHIFGCHAMLHVVDDGTRGARSTHFSFTGPIPKEYNGGYMPLVVSPRIRRMAILDVKPKIKAADFPLERAGTSDLYIPGTQLVNKIEDLQKQARNILFNHFRELTDSAKRTNFRALYALEPRIIKKLQTFHFGVNPKNHKQDLAFLRELPKAELHCHFGGILSPSEMIEVAMANEERVGQLREQNTDYDQWLNSIRALVVQKDIAALKEEVPNVKELRREKFPGIPEPYTVAGFLIQFHTYPEVLNTFIYGAHTHDIFQTIGIETYERLGDLQGSGLLQSEASIRAACRVLIKQCERENVRYLEIRHSPIKYTRGGLEAARVVSIIREELEQAETTVFKSIFIASRHGKMSEIHQHIELALELMEKDAAYVKWIVGFDLAGAESAQTPAGLRNAFLPLMEKCVNLTIHAGEDEPVQNIWEAVYHLNADRIGHGLTLNENEKLKKRFLDRKIAIEMCPSSNDQIVGYSEREYPLKRYLEEGLRVTVNSDNPGISVTNFSNEYLKAARLSKGGLSLWEILQLLRNSFQAAFLPFAERQRLLLHAEKEIIALIDTKMQD